MRLCIPNACELANQFGYWDEHPDHPESEWKALVTNDETRYGYWDWVVSQLSINHDEDT